MRTCTVEKGEFVFVVGAPPARAKARWSEVRIMREERPTSGQVIVDGVDVSRQP